MSCQVGPLGWWDVRLASPHVKPHTSPCAQPRTPRCSHEPLHVPPTPPPRTLSPPTRPPPEPLAGEGLPRRFTLQPAPLPPASVAALAVLGCDASAPAAPGGAQPVASQLGAGPAPSAVSVPTAPLLRPREYADGRGA